MTPGGHLGGGWIFRESPEFYFIDLTGHLQCKEGTLLNKADMKVFVPTQKPGFSGDFGQNI